MDIRVLVASEVRLYRDALQRVLQGAVGIALVGVASSADEVIKQACRLIPAVVVIDMAMVENFSAAQPIARVPQVGCVVVLGIPEVPSEVIACLPSAIHIKWLSTKNISLHIPIKISPLQNTACIGGRIDSLRR